MDIVEPGSPADEVCELITDLKRVGRMSRAEGNTILRLIWHPDFPASLRENPNSIERYMRRRAAEMRGDGASS